MRSSHEFALCTHLFPLHPTTTSCHSAARLLGSRWRLATSISVVLSLLSRLDYFPASGICRIETVPRSTQLISVLCTLSKLYPRSNSYDTNPYQPFFFVPYVPGALLSTFCHSCTSLTRTLPFLAWTIKPVEVRCFRCCRTSHIFDVELLKPLRSYE